MSLSLYDASIPTFLHTLRALKAILEKAVAHAEARKFDPNVFVSSRLYPDMLPFKPSDPDRQRRRQERGRASERHQEPPKFEDTETTMAELIARVTKTIDYLEGFKPEQFAGDDNRVITIKIATHDA